MLYLLVRIALLVLLAMVAMRVWRRWQASLDAPPAPPAEQRADTPPAGFAPDADPMVRCERCGIRAPASQVAAIRGNCKLCGPDAPPTP